jgi:hypothetical protein
MTRAPLTRPSATLSPLRGARAQIARGFAIALLIFVAACRTARPAGEQAVAPLSGTASQELAQRRDRFVGQRSVIRIRTMNGTQTQSARAQLQVGRAGDMLITIYAPVINTTALRLYAANGQIVFVNDIDKTAWQGSATDFTGSFGFVGSNPAALAFLILGLPPRAGAAVTYSDTGIQSARLQDMVVAYDPPVYPPQKVVIVRGMQRVEIDHLEDYVSPEPIAPLTVPAGYRCCVLPQI